MKLVSKIQIIDYSPPKCVHTSDEYLFNLCTSTCEVDDIGVAYTRETHSLMKCIEDTFIGAKNL